MICKLTLVQCAFDQLPASEDQEQGALHLQQCLILACKAGALYKASHEQPHQICMLMVISLQFSMSQFDGDHIVVKCSLCLRIARSSLIVISHHMIVVAGEHRSFTMGKFITDALNMYTYAKSDGQYVNYRSMYQLCDR